jgi:hypothetical protein
MLDRALPYENVDAAQISKVRAMTPSVLQHGIMPATGQLVLRHRCFFPVRRFLEGFVDKFGADEKTFGLGIAGVGYSMMALLRPATLLNAIRATEAAFWRRTTCEITFGASARLTAVALVTEKLLTRTM